MAKSGVSMKWRFPAEAWPATPGRKPCSPSSACRSVGRLGDPRGRHADVLDDQRGPGRPQLADQPVHPLAHLPVAPRPSAASRVKRRLADQLAAREELGRACLGGVELGLVVGAELDQQRGRGRAAAPSSSRRAAACCRRRRSAPARPSARPRWRRPRRARQPARPPCRCLGKCSQATGRAGGCADGLEDRLGDERQRALRADQQAAEDLHRLVGVEERAEPVAGRVLDLELAPDPLRQLGVGADLVADLGQPGGQLGLGRGEALARRPGRRCRSRRPTAATKVSERTVR